MNYPEGEVRSQSNVDKVEYEVAYAKKVLAAIEDYERSAAFDLGVSVVIFGLRAKESSNTDFRVDWETRALSAKKDLSNLIRMRLSGVDNGGNENEASIAREIELVITEVEKLILVRNSVDGINFDTVDTIENACKAAIANVFAILNEHYSFGGSFEQYAANLRFTPQMEVTAPLLKAAALRVIKKSASGAANDAAADLSAADSPSEAPVKPEAVPSNVVESVQKVTASRVVARINAVAPVRPQVKAVENCDIDSLRSDFAAWAIQRANAKAAGDKTFRRWRTDVFFADICKSLNISSYRKDRMDADADYREKIINEVKSNLKKIDSALVRTFEELISR